MAAKTQKIVREGWSQRISVEWVELIADAPRNGAMSSGSHYCGGPLI